MLGNKLIKDIFVSWGVTSKKLFFKVFFLYLFVIRKVV